MGYLDIPFMFVKSPDMLQILSQIQVAVNTLNKDNFPNKINGDDILKPASTDGSVIKDYTLPIKKLAWQELPIPLVIPVQPASTTTTLDCGGFFLYDPVKFSGDGQWYLEAALKISNSAGTATAQLKQDTIVIGSVSSNVSTSWNVVRSSALTMPVSQAALTVTLTSSNSNYTAYLWAARLIYVS